MWAGGRLFDMVPWTLLFLCSCVCDMGFLWENFLAILPLSNMLSEGTVSFEKVLLQTSAETRHLEGLPPTHSLYFRLAGFPQAISQR